VEAGGGSALLKFGFTITRSPLDIAQCNGPSIFNALSAAWRTLFPALIFAITGLPSLSQGFCFRGFGGTEGMFGGTMSKRKCSIPAALSITLIIAPTAECRLL
jgi:hypothetical protein